MAMKGVNLLKATGLVISLWLSALSLAKSTVWVTSDGPAVYGAPITFYARFLDQMDDDIEANYIYEFKDQQIDGKTQAVIGSDAANATFVYEPNELPEGPGHRMMVKVWFQIFGEKGWIIADNETSFALSHNLIGEIVITQNGVPSIPGVGVKVAANKPVDVSFKLYDPSNFFTDFEMTYLWFIDGENSSINSSSFSHTFTAPKVLNITVIVTAFSDIKLMTRYGNTRKLVSVEDTLVAGSADRFNQKMMSVVDASANSATEGDLSASLGCMCLLLTFLRSCR